MNLSFTTIMLNEAKHVPSFVSMLQPFVDEIVVVDTGSTDETVELLKSMGCTVLETTMEHGFAAARNVGLGACRADWVLSIDADEVVSNNFMKWCVQYARKASPKTSAVSFTRQNYVDGVHISDETHVRMFRRLYGSWRGKIHESVVVKGRVYQAHEKCMIDHRKSGAMQQEDGKRYLDFYPKFNLGSGGRPLEGWVNLDIDPRAPDSDVADVFEELPGALPAAKILAAHVLEHVSYHKAAAVVGRWVDKLAPGGTIEIRVPDLTSLVRDFHADKLSYLGFVQLMYGGQATEHDYHYNAIDMSWIEGQLLWWGCESVERLKPTQKHELRVIGRKPS